MRSRRSSLSEFRLKAINVYGEGWGACRVQGGQVLFCVSASVVCHDNQCHLKENPCEAPVEALQEKISAYQQTLLRDLKLMKHRQVIHPVLQEGTYHPSSSVLQIHH